MLLEVRKTLVWGTAVAAVVSAMLLSVNGGPPRSGEAPRIHDDPGNYPTVGGELGSARNSISVGPAGGAR